MRHASLSLIGTDGVDALSAEIIKAIVEMNKKGVEPMVDRIIALTSARNRTSVVGRLTVLERYHYISRQRSGRYSRIVVLKPHPKVLTVDLEKVKRKPKPRVTQEVKSRRISHAKKCFDDAVKLALKNDEKGKNRSMDARINRGELFVNSRVTACKVG